MKIVGIADLHGAAPVLPSILKCEKQIDTYAEVTDGETRVLEIRKMK